MKKLYKLVITSYIGPFVLTFFVSLFILLMQFLWKYIDDLVGKGLEWYIIGELMFYASASLVSLALPLAVLISSIMTMGNFGEHYELVAMRASGISLRRVFYPLITFSVAVSLGAFYFSNNILPIANLKMGTLLYDIRHKKPTLDIRPGTFFRNIDGYVIRVTDKGEEGELYGVMIYDHSDNKGNIKVILADSGTMAMRGDRYLEMELFNGYSYEQQDNKGSNAKGYPHLRNEFKQNLIRFDLSGFEMSRSNEEIFKDNYKMQSLGQLQRNIDTLEVKLAQRNVNHYDNVKRNFRYLTAPADSVIANDTLASRPDSVFADVMANFAPQDHGRILEAAMNMARSGRAYVSSTVADVQSREQRLNRYLIEVHRKFTLSIACLILFFIGAPLGAIIRKGGLGLPTVFSIIFFLIYYVLSITGEKFAKEGLWPIWRGMWLSSMVLLPVGLFLTQKAISDSAMFEWEFYLRPFKQLIDRIRKK
ncbi:MAG: LptF/LptG family permease [Flavobacteriales bacterium]|nr:LptF/LptG family permease [Flavobacteriales bacterium]